MRTHAAFTRGLCRCSAADDDCAFARCLSLSLFARRWKNGDRDRAAREYRRAIGFGTDAVALAREWPTSVFATHPVTGPGQVSVSFLLSDRLRITRGNLAVLEGTSSAPAPGPVFGRVTGRTAAAASAGMPSLIDQVEQLRIATGPVTGAVCDACGTPRPADAHLRKCSRCNLASCASSHPAAVARE
jgi:hypothetical protein